MAAVTRSPVNRAYLSLGGNIGEPIKAMAAALKLLDSDKDTSVAAVSSLYSTPPWGKTDQPDFINAAAALDTSLTPRALIDLCLASERALKRERRERWGPRIIDIDILTFDDLIVDEPGLQIPHPRMLQRAFVLVPLAEIAAAQVVSGKPVDEWLKQIDAAGITRLPGGREWWRV